MALVGDWWALKDAGADQAFKNLTIDIFLIVFSEKDPNEDSN